MQTFRLLHIYRGIAALLVVLYHVDAVFKSKLSYIFLGNIFSHAHIGLDFFFILSGFIITYVHYHDRGEPQKTPFYLLKRFFRIYPPYWVALCITFALYALSGRNIGHIFRLDLPTLFKIIVLFPVWPHPIAPSWSLTYEVFFYLFFSLAIIMPRKRFLWILSISYSLILIIYNYVLRNSPRTFFLEFFILEFLLGVGIAYLVKNKLTAGKTASAFVMGISAVLLFCSWTLYQFLMVLRMPLHNNLRIVFFALPFTSLVYGSVCYEMQRKVKADGFLMMLGTVSYSLYLIHSIVVVAMMTLIRQYTAHSSNLLWLAAFPIVAASLTAAYLFYFIVEKPLLAFSKHVLSERR